MENLPKMETYVKNFIKVLDKMNVPHTYQLPELIYSLESFKKWEVLVASVVEEKKKYNWRDLGEAEIKRGISILATNIKIQNFNWGSDRPISFSSRLPCVVTGPNAAGKTTLVRYIILANTMARNSLFMDVDEPVEYIDRDITFLDDVFILGKERADFMVTHDPTILDTLIKEGYNHINIQS